mgnify:CR=1 FL=1
MRHLLGTALLALTLAGGPPPADGGDNGRCGQDSCSCKECDPRCRCCPAQVVGQPGPVVAAFNPTRGPVSADGVRATCDLPASLHIRNVGGSDGAGLCVFTSAQHAATWQHVRSLDGFREWMRRRPGGGWPEKFDQMVAAFCREKKVAIPQYQQHTGGDDEWLDLAMKTGRLVSVTYAGMDDFYRDRWGRPAAVAHMVNLAHLDATRAAIIDNNRPGVWVWMTRAEFLKRWRDMNGGWAFVLLDAPPPPHPAQPVDAVKFEAVPPAPPVAWAESYAAAMKRHKQDGAPVFVSIGAPGCTYCKKEDATTYNDEAVRDELAGFHAVKVDADAEPKLAAAFGAKSYPTSVVIRDGKVAATRAGYTPAEEMVAFLRSPLPEQPPAKVAPVQARADLPGGTEPTNYGLVPEKIHAGKRFYQNGAEVNRAEAFAALRLVDDSDRFALTFVGTDAELTKAAEFIAGLPDGARGQLKVKFYRADRWEVERFQLRPGATLRKPTVNRIGADAGYTPLLDPKSVSEMLVAGLGGKPVEPLPPSPPAPQPVVPPVPVDPRKGVTITDKDLTPEARARLKAAGLTELELKLNGTAPKPQKK